MVELEALRAMGRRQSQWRVIAPEAGQRFAHRADDGRELIPARGPDRPADEIRGDATLHPVALGADREEPGQELPIRLDGVRWTEEPVDELRVQWQLELLRPERQSQPDCGDGRPGQLAIRP